ncbi:hypothetical protein [Nonomuraea typhae]|uniref:hypothetical protein n=1 Tax=Nonomuraea typhae TaxID=2603600 RepID=UPI0012F7AA0A|nr:hypothetical protein [Nonomuraea typhae]
MRLKRALTTGALLALPLMAVFASPAMAATSVSGVGGQLTINSGNVGDEINISLEGGFLVVRNFKDTMNTPSFNCQRLDSRTVRCPSAGIAKIQVQTQGGADVVRNNTALPTRAFLGPEGDQYSGGSARDFVNGDEGNDLIDGNGGSDILIGDSGGFDQVFGGAGIDLCDAEAENSCEQQA